MQYLSLFAATAAFALSSSAQTVEPGYDSTLTSLPSSVAAVYDLPGPGVVYYDGRALVLDDGTAVRPILTFAAPPAFASFTIPVGQSAVLFGESSNGEIWYVPLAEGSSPRRVATRCPFVSRSLSGFPASHQPSTGAVIRRLP